MDPVQDLMDKLGLLKTRVSEVDTVITEYKGVGAQLKVSNEVLTEILNLLEPYKSAVAKYEAIIAEHQMMVKNNDAAIKLINEQADQLVAEAAKQKEEAAKRIAEKDAEIAGLKTKLEQNTATSQNVDSLTASLQKAEQEKAQLITAHADQLNKLEQSLAAVTAEKARLTEENAKSADETLRFTTALATANSAISELTKRLETIVNTSEMMETTGAMLPFAAKLVEIKNYLKTHQGSPSQGPQVPPSQGTPSQGTQVPPSQRSFDDTVEFGTPTGTLLRNPATVNNTSTIPPTQDIINAQRPGEQRPRVGGKRHNTGRRRTKGTRKSTRRHTKTQRKQKKKKRGTFRARR